MKVARAELLTRFYERDPRHDGDFVVGVRSTGIYCLPSCPAKKPKPENVEFFDDEEGARRSGFRACKRCRPDHFYRRYDPDLEALSRLVAEVRRDPASFAETASLNRRAGFGSTKTKALFRRHYHTTPAAFLIRARLEQSARALVTSEAKVLDIALNAGFESSSAFHENFQRQFRMAPGAYRKLRDANEFTLALPERFRIDEVFSLFGRDPAGQTERFAGRVAQKALLLDGRPTRVELRFSPKRVKLSLDAPLRLTRAARVEAHARVVRMLGLRGDPEPFERHVARRPELAPLIRGRRGLRIPLTSDFFEGLLWVIVGQQVNLAFASTCRARVIELAGLPVRARAGAVELRAHPTPEAVAQLDPADLVARQFSRRKAEYLIDSSRALASGELKPEEFEREPATRIEERLLAVRGLGPWSVQYLMMRALGLENCVPVGDVALLAALQRFFGLDGRPDTDETLRLMEPFAPYRSLASFHLWKSLGDPET